jgi:hypothetical protein
LTDGYDIQDAINSALQYYSIEDTAFIVRSNKERINIMNKLELKFSIKKVNCPRRFDGGEEQLFLVERF